MMQSAAYLHEVGGLKAFVDAFKPLASARSVEYSGKLSLVSRRTFKFCNPKNNRARTTD